MGSVYAFEALAVSTTAVGFTAATYDDARTAICTVEGAVVRFRSDGTDPTATVGFILKPGDVLELESPDELRKTKFISKDGATATVNAHFNV